jgi:hypothetical protein
LDSLAAAADDGHGAPLFCPGDRINGMTISPEMDAGTAFIRGLRIGSVSAPEADALVPSFLTTLVNVVECAPSRAICIVLPRVGDTANAVSVLVALSRFRRRFPDLVARYTENAFQIGELVSVLPTKLVYEFAGFFPERLGLRFKLRILDTTSAEARSCPADESLRLVRTTRRSPKGKSTSDLGTFKLHPIDQILGVATFGNTAILRNEVLLNENVLAFESFIAELCVTRAGVANDVEHPNSAVIKLAEAFPRGRVLDDGSYRLFDDRVGQPICAVSRSLDSIVSAAASLPDDHSVIVISGSRRAQNIQQIMLLAQRQRVVVFASEFDRDAIGALRGAGMVIWRPNVQEILEGAMELPPPGSLGASTMRAAKADGALLIDTIDVEDDRLSDAVLQLREVEAQVHSETDISVQQLVTECFAVAFRLSGWCGAPPVDDAARMTVELRELAKRRRISEHFMEEKVARSLKIAIENFETFAGDERGGAWRKFDELAHVLQASEERGVKTAVIVNSQSSAQAIRELIASRWAHAAVFSPRDLPSDFLFEQIVLTAWPSTAKMDKIIACFNTPHISLIGYAHERRWLNGYARKRAVAARSWSLEGDERVSLLGLPPIVTPEPAPSPTISVADDREFDAIARVENHQFHRRKGSARPIDAAGITVDAKYVGFTGKAYAYLTPTHRVPRLNGLLQGDTNRKSAVEHVVVDDLVAADSLLFRPVGSADVISLIAEEMYGGRYTKNRAVAESWRGALRSIGSNPHTVHQSLRRRGLQQHAVTVRGWMTDSATIGPQSENDIRIIADAAKDAVLLANAHTVFEAVRDVRGNHVQAGARLTEMLIAELPAKIHEVADTETRLDLTFGDVWIVQVEDVAPAREERSYVEVNRLLLDGGEDLE